MLRDTSSWFRDGEILSSNNFPAAVAAKPGIGPEETPTLARAALPRFAPLSDRRMPIKSDFHFVKMVRGEKLWAVARVGNHLGFVITLAAWIDANKIVGQNSFHYACVATCH